MSLLTRIYANPAGVVIDADVPDERGMQTDCAGAQLLRDRVHPLASGGRSRRVAALFHADLPKCRSAATQRSRLTSFAWEQELTSREHVVAANGSRLGARSRSFPTRRTLRASSHGGTGGGVSAFGRVTHEARGRPDRHDVHRGASPMPLPWEEYRNRALFAGLSIGTRRSNLVQARLCYKCASCANRSY